MVLTESYSRCRNLPMFMVPNMYHHILSSSVYTIWYPEFSSCSVHAILEYARKWRFGSWEWEVVKAMQKQVFCDNYHPHVLIHTLLFPTLKCSCFCQQLIFCCCDAMPAVSKSSSGGFYHSHSLHSSDTLLWKSKCAPLQGQVTLLKARRELCMHAHHCVVLWH